MDVKEINNGDGTISLCFEIDDELYNQLTEILAPQGLTLEKAIEVAYGVAKEVKFENAYFRNDIGKKALAAKQ